MLDEAPSVVTWAVLAALTALFAIGALSRGRIGVPNCLRGPWAFFLLLGLADWVSAEAAIWVFAGFSFVVLREFYSLVDIRLQDRWGILGAYLSIPFMTYYIHDNWYGMFIISIPVYTFMVIPFLVALGGGDARGTVFSVGAIDLGLFLFVYCLGHVSYLAVISVRAAVFLVVCAGICDLAHRLLPGVRTPMRLLAAVVLATGCAAAICGWAGIPWVHAAVLGVIIPLLVFAGHFTMEVLKTDLGVSADRLEPGKGLLLDALQAYLFPALITFHYLRWFLDWGGL